MEKRYPDRLVAAFGNDLTDKNITYIRTVQSLGYAFLALDIEAVQIAKKRKIPYVYFDRWISLAMINKAIVRAVSWQKCWYAETKKLFFEEGICWPKLDQDAMYIFWKEVFVASEFLKQFIKHNGVDVKYIGSDSFQPVIYFHSNDIWKTLTDHYLRRTAIVHVFRKYILIAGRLAKYVMTSMLHDGKIGWHKIVHCLTPRVYDQTRPILFVLNQWELDRYKTIIKKLERKTDYPVKVGVLGLNDDMCRAAARKYSIHVEPIPQVSFQAPFGGKFLSAYQSLQESKNRSWREIFYVLNYHFFYYCCVRWNQLITLKHDLEHYIDHENPLAVVTSQLNDAENQLPALVAHLNNIPTFSIPHALLSRYNTGNQMSDAMLVDSEFQKKVLNRIKTKDQNVIVAQDIIPYSSYATSRIKERYGASGRKYRMLVLLPSSSMTMNLERLFTPYVYLSSYIKDLENLISLGQELSKRIELIFKFHPLDAKRDVLSLVSGKFPGHRHIILPRDADLADVLEHIDLVIDMNNASGSADIHAIKLGKPLLFYCRSMVVIPDYQISGLYKAGRMIETPKKLESVIRRICKDPMYIQALREKSHKFFMKYLRNESAPSMADIISKTLHRYENTK